eukprot:scaffold100898_cov63-Phaeocystis_antarctica.AAC.2
MRLGFAGAVLAVYTLEALTSFVEVHCAGGRPLLHWVAPAGVPARTATVKQSTRSPAACDPMPGPCGLELWRK